MSRNMSWLRSTGSSLGRGSRCLLQANPAGPAWRASAAAVAQMGRIAKVQGTQPSGLPGRPFSTHKTANDDGRTSRFRRSGASLADSPARSDGEKTPAEPTSTQPDSAEPVASNTSTTGSQPVVSSSSRSQERPDSNPRMSFGMRKPVDTSSKEYKQFASRYVRFVVALPVFLVTSYFLYERRK
jgi:hypothetical protein